MSHSNPAEDLTESCTQSFSSLGTTPYPFLVTPFSTLAESNHPIDMDPEAGPSFGGDPLYSARYDPFGDELDQNPIPGSAANPVVGMSLSFPSQPRISEFSGMFNRKTGINDTLPLMTGSSVESTTCPGIARAFYPVSAGISAPVPQVPQMEWNQQSGLWNPVQNFGQDLALEDALPEAGVSSFSPTAHGSDTADSSSYPSIRPSDACVNPLSLVTGMSPRNLDPKIPSPLVQGLSISTSYHSSTSLKSSTTSGSGLEFQSFGMAAHEPPSASSASVDLEGWETLSPDNELEHRLPAEDMANEDELAELRETEMGGASRRAERRRIRNKLAQRAFRARAKVTKKDAVARLVEAEAEATNENKELDLLRTMVNTLQNQNTQLKHQIRYSNAQRRLSDVKSEDDEREEGQTEEDSKGKGRRRGSRGT